jgi:hypothetical protein
MVMVVVVVFVLRAVAFEVDADADADADAAATDPEDAAAVCGKDATEGPPLEAAWSFMVLQYCIGVLLFLVRVK